MDSKNFHSIIKGTWTVEYATVENGKLINIQRQAPDTARIDSEGLVKTIHLKDKYASIEKWDSYDNVKKVVYGKGIYDNLPEQQLELKVISLDKDVIKFEVPTFDEDHPANQGTMLIIYKRVRSNAR